MTKNLVLLMSCIMSRTSKKGILLIHLRGANLDQESPAKAFKVQAFSQVKKEMKKG
jgi:hypothetical protein